MGNNQSQQESGAKGVDEYLKRLPAGERKALEVVREAIRSAAPEAVERIAYQVPVYFDHGWLISFKTGKHFLSLITMSTSVIKQFARELAGYEISGTSIHFSSDQPLSPTLVKKIVKLRLAENIAKRANSVRPKRRKRYTMPVWVKAALTKAKLLEAYQERPPYQRNDYLMWIVEARQVATREKRLEQMMVELKQGNVYMKMKWSKRNKK